MIRVRISLAAIAFILAIAGTTTANANKTTKFVPLCSELDPDACAGIIEPTCCYDEISGRFIDDKPL